MLKLNPLLESDSIECAHNGNVLLQSSTKDIMCVQDSSNNDAGMISLNDLVNASIIGCTNNIAGVPSPCTKLANIPNSICSTLLEIDNQKIIIAQAISQVLTDKGSPLILQGQPKAKDIFELDEDIAGLDNAQNNNENAESINKSSLKSSAESNESNSKSNAKSNTDSSNSQSTQDSQKEILEMYFSYGEEMIKLEDDDTQFTKDINLHLATQGYNKGEVINIELERNNQIFSTQATIDENGKAIIKNVFND